MQYFGYLRRNGEQPAKRRTHPMSRVILLAIFSTFTLMMFAMSNDTWSRGRTFQSSDVAEANRLTNIAIKLYDAGKYDQALPPLIQALGIAEKSSGMLNENDTIAVNYGSVSVNSTLRAADR